MWQPCQVSLCSSVSMEVLKVVWEPQSSDTSSKTLDLFLGHLSMLQRKWNLLRLCTVSVVGVCVCSWIFYCWCKLCINELQFLLPLPPPHQMFVKLNPWMPAIEDGAPLLYCVWWFCWVKPCWLHWMPHTFVGVCWIGNNTIYITVGCREERCAVTACLFAYAEQRVRGITFWYCFICIFMANV